MGTRHFLISGGSLQLNLLIFILIFCIHYYLFIYFLLISINFYMINFTSNRCPLKLKSWHSPSHDIGTHTNKLMRLCIGCTTSLLCFGTLNLLIKWVSFTILEEYRVCEGNAEEKKKTWREKSNMLMDGKFSPKGERVKNWKKKICIYSSRFILYLPDWLRTTKKEGYSCIWKT